MKFYSFALAHVATFILANAETTSLRGAQVEDMGFWERQLGSSGHRHLTEQVDEDSSFWERELGGSHRRTQEDQVFWERELGGSGRRELNSPQNPAFDDNKNEDLDFWGRALGSSH